ncbi:hypothetical protein [Streptomyces sennicomposti]
MNPLALRYATYTALMNTDDVESVELVSPVPGEPVALTVHTVDGRTYTLRFEES